MAVSHCAEGSGQIRKSLTVNTLLVYQSLTLLCLVPFDDESVTKCEGRAGVCSSIVKVLALNLDVYLR